MTRYKDVLVYTGITAACAAAAVFMVSRAQPKFDPPKEEFRISVTQHLSPGLPSFYVDSGTSIASEIYCSNLEYFPITSAQQQKLKEVALEEDIFSIKEDLTKDGQPPYALWNIRVDYKGQTRNIQMDTAYVLAHNFLSDDQDFDVTRVENILAVTGGIMYTQMRKERKYDFVPCGRFVQVRR